MFWRGRPPRLGAQLRTDRFKHCTGQRLRQRPCIPGSHSKIAGGHFAADTCQSQMCAPCRLLVCCWSGPAWRGNGEPVWRQAQASPVSQLTCMLLVRSSMMCCTHSFSFCSSRRRMSVCIALQVPGPLFGWSFGLPPTPCSTKRLGQRQPASVKSRWSRYRLTMAFVSALWAPCAPEASATCQREARCIYFIPDEARQKSAETV